MGIRIKVGESVVGTTEFHHVRSVTRGELELAKVEGVWSGYAVSITFHQSEGTNRIVTQTEDTDLTCTIVDGPVAEACICLCHLTGCLAEYAFPLLVSHGSGREYLCSWERVE